MKNKLFALIIGFWPMISYSQMACDSLTITATTPATAVSCEDFLMIVTTDNPSNTNFSNINFAIRFHKSSSVSTSPSGTPNGAYRVYGNFSILAHTSRVDTIHVHYDCSSISIDYGGLLPMATVSIHDSIKVSVGGTPCATSPTVINYDLASPLFFPRTQNGLPLNGWTFVNREFSIKNNGSSSYFDNFFSFSDTLAQTAPSFMRIISADVFRNATFIGTFFPANDSVISFSLNTLSAPVNNGDSLRVIERFEVFDCPTSPASSNLRYAWGCSSSDICGSDLINLSFQTASENLNVVLPVLCLAILRLTIGIIAVPVI